MVSTENETRVPHPSPFEGWDSTTVECMGLSLYAVNELGELQYRGPEVGVTRSVA
jgi:hypothetical protein